VKEELILSNYKYEIKHKLFRVFTKEKDIITVGRNKDCTLHVDKSSSFSRVQFTIQYDDFSEKWLVYDGDKVKKSTNGTWLFLDNSFEIQNNTSFRIGSSLFNVELKAK